jgi:uncharacterized membrane protein YbhN (UPF0104 family)
VADLAGHPRRRRILDIVGILVTLASCAFVGKILIQYGQMPTAIDGRALAAPVIGLSVVYLGALVSLSVAWHQLLKWSGCRQISLVRSILIIGLTEIQKYIPTNVVHLVSRYLQAKKYGATGREVGLSSIAEVGLIAFTGMAFAVFGNVDYLANATHVVAPVWWVALVVCVVPLVFWRTTGRLVSHLEFFRTLDWSERGRLSVLISLACYAIFFLISGGIIFVLLLTLGPSVTLNFLSVVSIAALAWVLGFVVPGSPGGLGVREAVLVFVLSLSAGAVPMSLIAIAYRGVTLLGELWFFLICTFAAHLIQRRAA